MVTNPKNKNFEIIPRRRLLSTFKSARLESRGSCKIRGWGGRLGRVGVPIDEDIFDSGG